MDLRYPKYSRRFRGAIEAVARCPSMSIFAPAGKRRRRAGRLLGSRNKTNRDTSALVAKSADVAFLLGSADQPSTKTPSQIREIFSAPS